jgi:hypothetical protein
VKLSESKLCEILDDEAGNNITVDLNFGGIIILITIDTMRAKTVTTAK